MIKIQNPADCCGCSACANICRHNAITMKPDSLGFLYPEVNSSFCTDCGLCEKVCSFHADYDISHNLPIPEAYAVRHKDMREIETSRSGALFIALSDWVLNQEGVVYGAGYSGHFHVVHKRATTRIERDEFKGSKYVQSDLGDIFSLVKNDLKTGKTVLFSGTPCQTAGLNAYIGKKLRENLYLVDIVCHGVPSPYIWRDYLSYTEKKAGKAAISVDFRDKSKFGWAAHKESVTFEDYTVYSDYFSYLFCQCIMFRESCGTCHFSNLKRPSDITIADFWGWENTAPQFNTDNKGVSLGLINTEKGRNLFRQVCSDVNVVKADIENCLQPNLCHPSPIHRSRKKFEQDYARHGFLYIAKKYGNMGWHYKLRVLRRKINTANRLLLTKMGI